MDDFYLIAEVLDVYSTDGSVIVKSFSDFSEHFDELDKVFINFFGKQKSLDIEFTKKKNNLFILKFRRFDSEEDVLFLVGKKLFIAEEKLLKLPQDSYYIHDLVESDVYIKSEFFGKLVDVLILPNNDTYVIKTQFDNEVLIPAVKEFISAVKLSEKKIFLTNSSRMFFEDEN